MSLSKVDVVITNGNLGIVSANEDGIAGLIASGTATVNMPLNTGKPIFGTAGLVALGITAATHPSAYRHVQEFYAENREGLELWLMLCNPTNSMTDICDKNNLFAKKLVKDSGNRIRLVMITRDPDVSYTPTIQDGLDKDCYDALIKAQELAENFASFAESSPMRILIEGRSFTGNEADLADLHSMAFNRVGVVLMSSKNDGSSSVGLALGRKAGNPVQRKISRVKDGALPITECYVGATNVKGYAGVSLIHDKGFITARTFAKKTGFYFTSDKMATAETDDYGSLARGCIIDKAHIIAYQTFVEELDDEVDIDDDGKIDAGVLKNLEAKIENRINISMAGEISSFDAYINPAQNVISTNTIEIEMNIIPKGYSTNIKVKLGFKNPALTN